MKFNLINTKTERNDEEKIRKRVQPHYNRQAIPNQKIPTNSKLAPQNI